MADMKIVKFEISILTIGLKKPFITALRRVDEINDIIIKIHTNSDIVGYGEACAVKAITGTTNEKLIKELEEIVFPALVDQKIDKELIFKKLYTCKVSPEAKACVDIALFDLLSKEAGLSLYSYLGASDSSLQTDLTISVNEASIMQEDASEAVSQGFEVLKIKLDKDISKNIQRLKSINEILPSHIRLRLDPNQALTLEGCLDMLKEIKTDNIECIEQPFDADDLSSMKALKEMSIIPVLADESLFTKEDAQKLLKYEAIDMLNIKLMKCGGIYEALNITKLARRHGKTCMIGSMLEGPLSLLAAVSLGLSQENIIMADLDSPLYLKEHPLLKPFNLHQDRINLDKKPGLGVDSIITELNLFPSQPYF